MSYEKEQRRLESLWQDVLSDEDDEMVEDAGSSDDYVPSSSDESSDDELPQEKRFKSSNIAKDVQRSPNIGIPSTSTNTIYKQDHVSDTIEAVIQEYATTSSDREDNDGPDVSNEEGTLIWSIVTGLNLKQFTFTNPNCGIDIQLYGDYYNKSPFDFYKLFLTEEILTMMVTETNRYAAQCKEKETAPKARIHSWCDTDINEMQKFIGVLFWMGLCQYPSIESYWSQNILYENKIRSIMSRNRFQILLKMWHFHNNEEITGQRLQKISPLLDKLIENFQKAFTPKEAVCIDETLVPFRGRLAFKQFIKNKKHKFGIKLYKLCVEKGYTYNLTIYCGQDKVEGQSSSENIVLTLAKDLLNEGRTIYTDNYYTSVSLAHSLLDKQTHLVGTLRTNRKLNPKEVVQKQLKKGETVAAESNTGVVVQKWKDKRDVLTLSTKHNADLLKVTYGRKETEKPSMVVDYNNHKAYIDLSDQLKAYATSLRKGVKWYRKLAVELLIGTSLVNAFILHQNVANNKMTITKFKELVTIELLQLELENRRPSIVNDNLSPQHTLEDLGRNVRRRCIVCYKKLSDEHGRVHAQKKAPLTKLRCSACKQHYCLECFFEVHKCTTK